MDSADMVAGAEAEGQRLDRFLCDHAQQLGRAGVRRLIDAGLVQVNGRAAVAGRRLRAGDRVHVRELADTSAALPDAGAELRVVYEDAWLVVADKPAGMPSHPLRPGERGTLASALLARYPEMSEVGYSPREPGIVHRLDTHTSGLVLGARDSESFALLRGLLERGEIDKGYSALCAGAVRAPALHEAWLSAHGKRVTVREQPFAAARSVQTEIVSARRLRTEVAFSRLELRVHLARRHQIRAHLAALGHPIAGDALYGGPPMPGLGRHFLHAGRLRFTHPRTGADVAIEAELPPELQAVVEALEHGAPAA